MPESEYRICVDCEKKVARWFTSHTDKDPRCEGCATAKFKRDNPVLWDLKPKEPFFPPISA